MRQLVPIIMLLLAAPLARGEVRATLPMQGYCRVGMFMPVRVEGMTSGLPVEITGNGVITTRIGRDSIVAVLVTGSVNELTVNGAVVEGAVRLVPEGVRLIGSASAKPQAAEAAAIAVTLDPLDPVPGPASAWELLDELIIDADVADRIGDAKLMELLAGGLTVVAAGEARPAGSLPWQRERDAWALRQELHGPRGSVFPPAMLTVAGQPGSPEPFRRQALLAAALFTILATGAALWRTRFAVVATGALVFLCVAAAHAWKTRHPTTSTVGGSIVVEGPSFTQADAWRYHFASDDTTITLPAGARPVAASPDALLSTQQTLIAPDVFECRLSRGGRMVSMSRSLKPAQPSPSTDPKLTSPLAPLAKAGYLRPGVWIAGQLPAEPWPSVVLRPANP